MLPPRRRQEAPWLAPSQMCCCAPQMLELFKRNGLEHKEHDKIAWPPAPKYRESQRDTWVPRQIGDIPP